MSRKQAGGRGRFAVGVLALTVTLAGGAPYAAAQESPGDDVVTYAADVAPIFQAKCQVCHREGSIAPIELMTYEDVRKYSRRIRQRVEQRIMPPWHIDRTVGIQEFKNDRGLTDEQVETVLAWIDNGMPFGDEADMPAPRDFPDPDGWRLEEEFGKPDIVIPSAPFDLDAVTQDKWYRPVTETGITEPVWVRAIEIRPVGTQARQVMHHVLTFLQQDEADDPMASVRTSSRGAMGGPGLFMEWAVGKAGEIFPEGAGKLMLPNSKIRWELHMHAIGELVENAYVELGVWTYDEGNEPRNRTRLRMFDARGDTDLDIPPNQVAVTQEYHTLRWPARLENFQPHMHMRGKTMRMEAVLPDGRTEILSQVNNFQWNWHVNYIYADHVAPLLPAGTMIVITAWHDNTAENPNNPDPNQWVGWGDRTVDEMAHAWVDVTYLSEEEFEAEVAKREAMKAESQSGSNQPGGFFP